MKVAYIDVTPELVLAMLGGVGAARTNLPDDARFAGMYYDDVKRVLRVHFTSETLHEVPEGWEVPRFELALVVHG